MPVIDDPQILEAIKSDSVEHIQKLNTSLMNLEEDPGNLQIQQELMRGFHNIKGLARVMDFHDVGLICHRSEDLMRDVLSSQQTLSREQINSIFKAIDAVEMMLNAAIQGDETFRFDTSALLQKLESGSVSLGHDAKAPADGGGFKDSSRKAGASGTASVKEETPKKEGIFAFEIQDWQKFSGNLKKTVPPSRKEPRGFAKPPVPEKKRVKPAAEKLKNKKSLPRPEKPSFTKAAPVPRPSPIYESIRIDTKKIDEFINLSGEMIISRLNMKNNLKDIDSLVDKLENLERKMLLLKRDLSMYYPEYESQKDGRVDSIVREVVNLRTVTDKLSHQFARNFNRIRALTDEFKDKVMRMRMVPASNLFDMFLRSMRDLALEFGKEVTFRHMGADTEIDKHMIERLREPILHLLRNAVDHGIESPEERKRKGKDEKGIIVMSASHYGSQIVIDIEDDGQGINENLILKKAIRKGLINKTEARLLPEHAVLNMVFQPNFSTRDIITEISGRGVGMDIVKKGIEEIQGTVSITTKKDQGTKFSLKLPLTMSTTGTMLVRLNSQLFAIPCTAVDHTLEISSDKVHRIESKEAIQVDNHIIPLVKMKTIFGWEDEEELNPDKMSIIVLGEGTDRMAFWVDESIREQEIVMKGLGAHLKKVHNISGATILGDGELVFIVDFEELMSSARVLTATGSITYQKSKKTDEAPVRKKMILVVDDQLTIRQIQKMSLESAGYRVETAINGAEAWDKLQKRIFDMVVTDVEMPEMNGFELTLKIKKSKEYKHIPVVIVTSMESESDQRKGVEVGANAYFTKGGFNKSQCLETISMLMM